MPNKLLDKYLIEIQVNPLFLTPTILSLFNVGYQMYRQKLSQAQRVCGELTGQEKSKCMLQLKVLGKKMQVQKLKEAMSKCTESKKPNKCREKIKKKINDESQLLHLFNSRLKRIKK